MNRAIEITTRILKSGQLGDLPSWLQCRGWFLSILVFDERKVWLEALRGDGRVEVELRGMSDIQTAAAVLKTMVIAFVSKTERPAA